ncbi:MAG: Twin-arginine translocation pathway signal [Desulfobacterales bacterium]|nr:MAG: Twin-arginine translocation pathway signal [Desulfobacterales bacterium]
MTVSEKSIQLLSRRGFIKKSCLLTAALAPGLAPISAWAAQFNKRSLSFYHTHTCQSLDIVYAHGDCYDIKALKKIDDYLKDFRTGDKYPIDRRLLDQLWIIEQAMGKKGTFEVISGYRSPVTNESLRKNSSGVAKRSFHMQGRAIDIRFSGASTAEVRDFAVALKSGGVGYYPKSDFVHLDTGKVRTW